MIAACSKTHSKYSPGRGGVSSSVRIRICPCLLRQRATSCLVPSPPHTCTQKYMSCPQGAFVIHQKPELSTWLPHSEHGRGKCPPLCQHGSVRRMRHSFNAQPAPFPPRARSGDSSGDVCMHHAPHTRHARVHTSNT